MGIRRTAIVVMTVVLMSGAPIAQASVHAGARSAAPAISLELTAGSAAPGVVTVRYSVLDMPHNARVVLERRDTPKGRYWPIDSALGTPGELVDSDPVDRPATYRVVLEGPRGFALATKEAGHVG